MAHLLTFVPSDFRFPVLMVPPEVFRRYARLQKYVGWTDQDAQRVQQLLPLTEPAIDALVDDFYRTIESEPEAARVITGGPAQIQRLKATLRHWIRELLTGPYDEDYVARRWRVGWRHVEIGLDSVYTSVALSRLRYEMAHTISANWPGTAEQLQHALNSFHRLVDLDLSIIQDAYESEYVARQRRAERQRSEAAFRRLVEAAGSMIVMLRADRTLAYMNPFGEQLTGFAAAAVRDQDFLSIFVPPEERETMEREFRAVFQEQAARGFESQVVCRDGSLRWLLWNAQQFHDGESDAMILIIGQDVTEQKRAEERALQSERLAAIGQTVTGLAHESRNAFQRSQACLELLELELQDRPEELELVGRIQRALDHLHRLYEEVRDYAAPVILERQPCDVAHLWRDAWSHLETQCRTKNVVLRENLLTSERRCSADWFALGQVFRNIFENALAASPENSSLEVQCAPADMDGRPALQVSIRDSGPGIPEEIRGRVFDAFFTTRNKGTGLGMAIAKRIVEAHGGRIVIGRPAAGAEFVMVLPRWNNADG